MHFFGGRTGRRNLDRDSCSEKPRRKLGKSPRRNHSPKRYVFAPIFYRPGYPLGGSLAGRQEKVFRFCHSRNIGDQEKSLFQSRRKVEFPMAAPNLEQSREQEVDSDGLGSRTDQDSSNRLCRLYSRKVVRTPTSNRTARASPGRPRYCRPCSPHGSR